MEACPWAVVRRGTGGATEPARDGDRLQSASPGRSGRRAPGRASLALQPARSGGQCKRSGSRERRGGRQRDEQSQRDELPRVHSDLCIDEYFVRQKKRGAGRPGEVRRSHGRGGDRTVVARCAAAPDQPGRAGSAPADGHDGRGVRGRAPCPAPLGRHWTCVVAFLIVGGLYR